MRRRVQSFRLHSNDTIFFFTEKKKERNITVWLPPLLDTPKPWLPPRHSSDQRGKCRDLATCQKNDPAKLMRHGIYSWVSSKCSICWVMLDAYTSKMIFGSTPGTSQVHQEKGTFLWTLPRHFPTGFMIQMVPLACCFLNLKPKVIAPTHLIVESQKLWASLYLKHLYLWTNPMKKASPFNFHRMKWVGQNPQDT